MPRHLCRDTSVPYHGAVTTPGTVAETSASAPARPARAGLGWLPGGALIAALAALGFAVPWWIENGASVYVSLLATGFSLCL